jgi:hypothetical protein
MTISSTIIVLIGGAPFDFARIPEKLYNEHNVRGVINMCEEYKGPLRKYKELGIEELYLPTTDHFEPELEDLMVRARTHWVSCIAFDVHANRMPS